MLFRCRLFSTISLATGAPDAFPYRSAYTGARTQAEWAFGRSPFRSAPGLPSTSGLGTWEGSPISRCVTAVLSTSFSLPVTVYPLSFASGRFVNVFSNTMSEHLGTVFRVVFSLSYFSGSSMSGPLIVTGTRGAKDTVVVGSVGVLGGFFVFLFLRFVVSITWCDRGRGVPRVRDGRSNGLGTELVWGGWCPGFSLRRLPLSTGRRGRRGPSWGVRGGRTWGDQFSVRAIRWGFYFPQWFLGCYV